MPMNECGSDSAVHGVLSGLGKRSLAIGRARAQDLLQGASEVIIEHGADAYRLRRTSNGKLILNT